MIPLPKHEDDTVMFDDPDELRKLTSDLSTESVAAFTPIPRVIEKTRARRAA